MSQFIPSYGLNVAPINTGISGIHTHETFKFGRYGTPYGGHTTFQTPDNRKIHIPWG